MDRRPDMLEKVVPFVVVMGSGFRKCCSLRSNKSNKVIWSVEGVSAAVTNLRFSCVTPSGPSRQYTEERHRSRARIELITVHLYNDDQLARV